MASTPSTSSTLDNHASPAGSTLGTSISSASSQHGGDDSSTSVSGRLVPCRWGDCRKMYEDPEDLYHHLCNDHVGRKSTNNLCLSCKWEGCDVTCAKRDHITSHLRVHTPLKPHSCEACGKLFKRPQDLKKHERIHTEQHFQARQLKYQPPSLGHDGMPGMAYHMHPAGATYGVEPLPAATASAAAAAAVSHGHSWNQYNSHTHGPAARYSSGSMYPSLASQRNQSTGSNSSAGFYPMVSPHQSTHLQPNYSHTPVYSRETSSTTSLSPLSSHLGTPGASGNSPAPASVYYSGNASTGHGGDQRAYLTMQPDRPKMNDDPNSYSYLSQGSSSLAGSKRSYDAATATFLDDVRRKRIAPTYDDKMAERIDGSFAQGIDDASLEAILSSFGFDGASMTSSVQGQSQYPAQSASQDSSSVTGSLSLPDALKMTDLAELNAFLLQVGASASRGIGNEASTSVPMSSASIPSQTSAFDFQAALLASGLESIPGLDNSLLQPMNESSSPQDGASWPSANVAASAERPIAQLPHRAGTATSQQRFAPMNTSFDSVQVPRGHAYVPQLGAKDMTTPLYRHVEPLMRAAPLSTEEAPAASFQTAASKHMPNAEDEDDDERTSSAAILHRPSPSPSAATTATGHQVYPRILRGDSLRRLPSPSGGSASSVPSIASILNDVSPSSRSMSTTHDEWRESKYKARDAQMPSRSPSPPPTANSQRRLSSTSSSTEASGSSSSSGNGSMYPRLTPLTDAGLRRDRSIDGIATDVAALDVAGSEHGSDEYTATSQGLMPTVRRRQHVQAILALLVALNRPRAQQPARTDSQTPPANASSQGARRGPSDQDMEQSPDTPTLQNARPSALPRIRDLLNDVDAMESADRSSFARGSELRGAGGRCIMEVDV